ncbi:hypothetical protein [Kitasatospora sp. NPDC059327]|uniref:restriction endonuclease subunit S n=1 Tax=Kitasatospora sp. NPDC059327 TaxID=3346803 RepID=UPI0036ADBD30
MKLATVGLGQAADINPRLIERPGSETTVSFLGMADIDAESGTTPPGSSRMFGEVSKGYTQFADRDLLVAKITPCFENGKIAQATLGNPHGAGSTEFHVIRPDRTRFDDRFMLHFLRQPHIRAAGELRMTGSGGQRRVPEAFLAGLEIPLIALEGQRRIARVLDRVDALRAKRREASALLDDLAGSVFFDMFGDVAANNYGWDDSRTLGEVAFIGSGITKGRKLADRPMRSVPYMAVVNVQERRLDLSVVKEIEATEDEVDRYRLLENDLLLTEGGDPDKLGRGTLWHNEIPDCIHQNHIFRVRLREDSGIDPVFLNWLVASDRGRRYFLRSAKQTTGIASINATQLRNFPLLAPPIELQKNFSANLKQIERRRSLYEKHLVELDTLFASLQHLGFRGELWPDAPSSGT